MLMQRVELDKLWLAAKPAAGGHGQALRVRAGSVCSNRFPRMISGLCRVSVSAALGLDAGRA